MPPMTLTARADLNVKDAEMKLGDKDLAEKLKAETLDNAEDNKKGKVKKTRQLLAPRHMGDEDAGDQAKVSWSSAGRRRRRTWQRR